MMWRQDILKILNRILLEILYINPIVTFLICFIPLYFVIVFWVKDLNYQLFNIDITVCALLCFLISSIMFTKWIRNKAYWILKYQERIIQEYHKTIFYGILAMIAGFFFAKHLIGNPINGGLILLWGETTNGYITDTYQDVEGNETGTHYSYDVKYSFKLNGKL